MMTLEQWIHLGQKARDAGMLYLLLTGGEPLLWPDFWELYDALYEMGLLIGINTNGSLIDDNARQLNRCIRELSNISRLLRAIILLNLQICLLNRAH